MADNTLLNPGTGGDTTRTVAKTANAPAKTQAVVLDVGGGSDSSAELILAVGQKTGANSLSLVLASDALAEPGGVKIAAATMPSGGLGLTGWLSAIWQALTGTISTQAANPSAIYVNLITPGLGTGGVGTAFPSQILINGAVVKALRGNTGTIYVGPSGVTNSQGGSPGYPIVAGEACSVAVQNLSAIYAIAENSADAVAIIGN